LVTGGAGFIGSHLVDYLVKQGYKVRILDNLYSGSMINLDHHEGNPDVQFFKKDICAPDLEEIFEDVDKVFHLAAIPRVQRSFREPEETHRVNVFGTMNILEHAKNASVSRFVLSSSSSIYGEQPTPFKESFAPSPMSPYARQKLQAETYAGLYNRIHGIDTACLRYFNVYGPRQNPTEGYACLIPKSIGRVLNGDPPLIYGDGEQRRDFTYISDVVLATYQAGFSLNGTNTKRVFNIGCANSKSVNQVINQIVKGTGIEAVYLDPVREPKCTEADITNARKYLSWEPSVSLEDGLELTKKSIEKKLERAKH